MPLKDKEARSAYNRAYREKRRAELDAYHAAYREAHREQLNAQARVYQAVKREERKPYLKEWRDNNRDKLRTYRDAHRAQAQASAVRHSARQWRAMRRLFGDRCLCCGQSAPDIVLTKDHVVPLSEGGSDGIENIQPLCLSCNSAKHKASTDYRLPFAEAPEYKALMQSSSETWTEEARRAAGVRIADINRHRIWTPEMRARLSKSLKLRHSRLPARVG